MEQPAFPEESSFGRTEPGGPNYREREDITSQIRCGGSAYSGHPPTREANMLTRLGGVPPPTPSVLGTGRAGEHTHAPASVSSLC